MVGVATTLAARYTIQVATPATLGSALQSSSEGMAKARRTMGQAASSIASFGSANVQQAGGDAAASAGKTSGLAGDIVQLSEAATSFKANAAVARIASQAMSETVGLGGKLDREV